ncbi:hypothetical protein CEUSTIGMA_g8150.t1 [Chlamydomonas eustigma]|uniref:Anticodon-binding domain-containing protein n=1 Tax=Chlamydomonas eustigma TaxID=1157962 RepID=A0A250XC98_9CHLO|nr:hypothetical protein CEUSTIGMA_g8150.t1 [Chlamydomonas eustigma]|eukprot:GAX80715.1 hypothetical protein CEUSTIGMA_g8150.t1 [Chlamydomonas eustigma]
MEGKSYKPQKYKRKLFVAEGAGKTRRERKKEKNAQKSAIRVVVLPIFWEERTDEMKSVLEAAKKVEGLLSTLGVRVVVDDNNKFKPGPRMKHWEELGVPVRVEVGPQDVAKGSCVVAKAGEPGTVAQKTTVKMSTMLVKHVRRALTDAGVLVLKDATQEGDDEGDDALSEDEGVVLRVKGEGGVSSAGQSGVPEDGGAGGDDMDDFELEVEAEEEVLTMSKKELAKRKRKKDKAKKKATKLQGMSPLNISEGAMAHGTGDAVNKLKGAEVSREKSKTVIF